jgi:pyridoxal phosphate enzyme (YggS family)
VTIEDAVAAVRVRIALAADHAGIGPDDVTLVAATKSVGVDAIREAFDAGVADMGENRAQDLVAKATGFENGFAERGALRWHFIGRMQRNKVRAVAPYVSLWQSVDREELAQEIAQRAPGAHVLVQVNLAHEPQKGGCAPNAAAGLVDYCRSLGLAVEGLMTVPALAGDPTPTFRECRRLTDRLGLFTCSMGMSNDFEDAIREGATMVRVGSAIFGPRPPDSDARR